MMPRAVHLDNDAWRAHDVGVPMYMVWLPAENERTHVQSMVQMPVRADDARGALHAAMSQAIDRGASPDLLGPPLVAELDRFGRQTDVVEMGPFDEDGPGDGRVREPRRPLPTPPSLRMELPGA